MTETRNIPEDVMKAARAQIMEEHNRFGGDPYPAEDCIARVIMAERERASELLDALKTLVAVLPDAAFNEPTGGALSLAKLAISKAEG